MAAGGILDKLTPLSDKAATLGNKHRGDAIQASDWNAMVDVMRGLLDAVGGQENALTATFDARYAVKAHDHAGEVTMEWLDPGLRASIGGIGGGIALRASVDDVNKSVAAFAKQLSALQEQVQSQQRALDQFSVDGLDAKHVLSGFEQRFATLEGVRANVTALTAQLNGLSAGIDTVMKLRATLSDAAGKPIDVGKIQSDVATLKSLQDNLAGLDGKPVRVRDILVRQQNVEQAVGVDGGAGLDSRISAAVEAAKVPLAETVAKQIDARAADLKAANDASTATLRSDVAKQLDTARGALSEESATRIADVSKQLSAATAQQITVANTALRADVLDAANKSVQSAVAAVPAQVQSGVAALRGDLQKSLSDTLTSSLTATVTAQLATATAGLSSRVASVESAVGGLRDTLPAQITAAVTTARTATTAELSALVDTKVATARGAIQDGVTNTVTTALAQQLAPAVESALQTRAPAIAAQVDAAVKSSVAAIPTTVSNEVKAQVASLQLDAKLAQQQATLTSLVTAQVDQKVAVVAANQSSALAELNTRLSSRIDSVAITKSGPAASTTVGTTATTGATTTLLTAGGAAKTTVVKQPGRIVEP